MILSCTNAQKSTTAAECPSSLLHMCMQIWLKTLLLRTDKQTHVFVVSWSSIGQENWDYGLYCRWFEKFHPLFILYTDATCCSKKWMIGPDKYSFTWFSSSNHVQFQKASVHILKHGSLSLDAITCTFITFHGGNRHVFICGESMYWISIM